jgi:hypothetical protein
MTALVALPNPALETTAQSWPDRVEAMMVVDQDSYNQAAEALLALAALEKEIIAEYKEPKQKADAAHKAVVALEKKWLAPVQVARSILSPKIRAFENEQKRIQQEAQRRAEEEAQRIADELALQQAAAAEEAGAPDEIVTQILETPQPVIRPKVAPVFQKASGLGQTTYYSAELVDVKALCKAVIDGTLPENAVLPNMVLANARARTEKDSFKMPGFKLVKQDGTRVSTR